MKVIVCGDRNWTNKNRIREILSSLPNLSLIIEGGAKGADTLAKEVAEELEIPIKEFKAEWNKYGRAAGPIRNNRMLNEKPDLVIAFHNNLSKSKGTKNMLDQAIRDFIVIRLFTETEELNEYPR